MDEFESNKIYKPSRIPNQQKVQEERQELQNKSQNTKQSSISLDEGLYYEIEYDSSPIPGVGKFVLKSQKIQEPQKDEVRELFYKMRDIAGIYRTYYDNSKIFDQRVKQHNAMIFYKQGIFMKDFTDDYTNVRPLSQYFPNYQAMGYEQLRTYFTWRTEVRKGNVTDTSLSYGFLYIYELLHNIGVNDPMEGLDKLMFFWKAFRLYQPSIDRYVLRWLKDYHIYYPLAHSFKEFIDSNNLTDHYPKMVDRNDDFALFSSISKYDIKKSSFYKGDYVGYIQDSIRAVIEKLRKIAKDHGYQFDESVFQPTKRMIEWKPFKDALFYPWMKQEDRVVVFSENEIYINAKNRWAFNTAITSEEGRQFIGYIIKQIEVELRQITKYKYKLTATMDGINHVVIRNLQKANISLEKIIKEAVINTYKEATKTIVAVDIAALSRIREEAMVIQEKLVVENEIPMNSMISIMELQPGKLAKQKTNTFVQETEQMTDQGIGTIEKQDTVAIEKQDTDKIIEQGIDTIAKQDTDVTAKQGIDTLSKSDIDKIVGQEPTSTISYESEAMISSSSNDVWVKLRMELTDIERNALAVLLHGEMELKKYADQYSIMLEVLVEGINEKAMDFIGDSLIDEEFVLYDDYIENVKELIG